MAPLLYLPRCTIQLGPLQYDDMRTRSTSSVVLVCTLGLLSFSCSTIEQASQFFYKRSEVQAGSTIVVLPIADFDRQNSGRLVQNSMMMELKRRGYRVAEREAIQQVVEEQNLRRARQSLTSWNNVL